MYGCVECHNDVTGCICIYSLLHLEYYFSILNSWSNSLGLFYQWVAVCRAEEICTPRTYTRPTICCSVLQCVALCVAVCCSVLQCVAVCCSISCRQDLHEANLHQAHNTQPSERKDQHAVHKPHPSPVLHSIFIHICINIYIYVNMYLYTCICMCTHMHIYI